MRRPSRLLRSLRTPVGNTRTGDDPVGGGRDRRWSKLFDVAVDATVTMAVTTMLGFVGALTVQQFGSEEERDPGPPPVRYKTAATDAFSVRVPTSWGFRPVFWELPVAARQYPGAGLLAGQGQAFSAGGPADYAQPTLYLGASTTAATDLLLPTRDSGDLERWVRTAMQNLDYAVDQCVLVDERPADLDGYIGRERVWKGCSNLPGSRAWEVLAVSESGDVLVDVFVNLPKGWDSDVAHTVLDTWVVKPLEVPRKQGSRTWVPADWEGLPLPDWVPTRPGAPAFP